MKEQIKSHEAKMQKTLDVLSASWQQYAQAAQTPAVLDKITVEYYGAPTPLNQVAAISTPDPRTLAIQPWDGSVPKRYREGDPGLRPRHQPAERRQADPSELPAADRERRRELIRGVSPKTGEEAKVALRNIRRDALDKFKAAQKKSEITEDELHDGEDKMQKLTDKYVKEVDAMVAKNRRNPQRFNRGSPLPAAA